MKFKTGFIRPIEAWFTLCFFLITIVSCSNDKDIKGDIVIKAKSDPNFVGVNYTVSQKVVTLYGVCPTIKSREDVEKAVKSINVIQGIRDNIIIGPVILNTFFTQKQSVDSLLASYPGVMADVNQTGVVLKGTAKQPDITKLINDIKKLNITNIENQVNGVTAAK